MTPERRREIERNKKQRWRERALYANGLTSAGTPLRFPAIREARVVSVSSHPADCPCYDCLFNSPARKAGRREGA